MAALLLSACNATPQRTAQSAPTPDARLVEAAAANAVDPLLDAVLADPLLTDMDLRTQANADAVRPPPRPHAAMIPLDGVVAAPTPDFGPLRSAPPPVPGGCPECAATDRPLATIAAGDPALRTCAPRLALSAAWANRLIGVPLYRNARVIEGARAPGCALARFSAAEPVALLLDYYTTQARGFTLTHRSDGTAHMLSGTAPSARFTLYLRPRADGGTDAVLLTAN